MSPRKMSLHVKVFAVLFLWHLFVVILCIFVTSLGLFDIFNVCDHLLLLVLSYHVVVACCVLHITAVIFVVFDVLVWSLYLIP